MKITKLFSRVLAGTLLLAGLTLPMDASAQNVTTPYSMYGYGVLGDAATSMQKQMGGIGLAMNSGRQINVMNPASYAAIDSLTFLFDLGADMSILLSKENKATERSIGGGLDYITMQFPLTKYGGASIGMLPYSSVGYAFGNDIKHGASENQGSGGINQAYLGLSGGYAGFTVGANVSYNFGNIVNQVFITPSGSSQTLTEHVMQVRDWNITVGAQYTLKWRRYNKLVLGATYSPKKTFRGKTWVTKQDLTLDAMPDTVCLINMKDRYYQPNTVGAGISYSYTRQSHIMVEADFQWQDWSKALFSPLFSETGQVVFAGMKFDNRYRVAVGGEYTPNMRGNYLQRITYRIGAHYTRDYLDIKNYDSATSTLNEGHLRDYGISCGFGLPTPEGKTMINLGFEWKRRVTSPYVFISENYFNITLGINFNELWFWQRKIR